MMNKQYLEVIPFMLQETRIHDLLRLMEGDSEYSSESIDNIPINSDEVYIFGMALEHVRFISKYGFDVGQVLDNGKVFSAYPEYFNQWLKIGAKGIEENELESYLFHNPF